MDEKSFLGAGLKFPLQLDPKTGKIAMVSAEDDIAEAIRIIIGTSRGERVMRPEFGSGAQDYIFESSDGTLTSAIEYELSQTISRGEPRVRDVSVSCRENTGAAGALEAAVAYTVRSTNNRYNKVYPFIYNEGSEEI